MLQVNEIVVREVLNDAATRFPMLLGGQIACPGGLPLRDAHGAELSSPPSATSTMQVGTTPNGKPKTNDCRGLEPLLRDCA